ncbi:MAG TPA: TonB-dependent receptor [Novosphingobium sp.]|nr:TonB-dependent receptor [Novosphingobium sp.]HQA17605.1 TonB-dependent receptor [Novosphingobium sp.]
MTVAAFGTATAAQAQDAAASDSEETSETAKSSSGDIVVTGSRVRRDEYSAIEPVTVVTSAEITQSGFNSASDALQSTEVTQGSAQINNYYGGFVTDGGTGVNTLGLRGLGPARTLVLLNGRRIAPAGTRGAVLAADLNVLPTSIIDRIEILKAGASSVYGSDAVAGVVNIVTDNKVRGLTIEGQVNVPQIGAGVDRRVSATFGFGNDRLDVIGSFEYRKRDAVRLSDVDFTSCPVGGYIAGEGAPFGSDDDVNFEGNSCFTLDNGGVTINTLGVPTRQAIGRTSGVLGNYNRLVPDATATTGTIGYKGVGYYDRDTFHPDMQEEEVVTPVETYTGFVSGSYQLDILGNAEIYAEVLGARRKSANKLYRQLSIDYLQGSPLLPIEFRNGAFALPNNVSSGRNVAARAFVGFGLTDAKQEVDYVRAGVGLRGDFALPGWRYDVYMGKSWTDGTYEIESFLIDRMANSMLVTDNGDGTFSCANQATFANCVAAPALSAAVIGGNLPQAWRDYILQNTIGTTKFRETTFSASIDGPLFKLPGGDVQLVLGVEYRKQSINDTPDPNAQSGNLLGLTAAVPTRGSDSVKEVFGEVFVPLISDKPFFHNLSLNGSLRYTDYKSYGSDTTYKIAGEWEFFQGFGIRGSYGTSYRAPALAEQFLGATSGFISSGFDPCDADNFPANPANYTTSQQTIAANCASTGINVATFQQNSGITVFTRGGAETGLSAETSRNWSAGVVLKPKLGGSTSVSLALDYFDIKVSNGVSSLSGSTILSRCYSATDFDPATGFCRFVSRNANNQLTVTSGYVNLSTDIVKGFEFNGRFATDVFGGRFTLNANLTKYTEQSDKVFAEEFLRDANGTLNNPDWVGSADFTFRKGKVTFRYGFSWIDSSSGTYDYLAFNRTTGQVNTALAQSYRDRYLLEVPDYWLHSASLQFNVNDKFEMTMGVRNLFDAELPKITAAVTTIGNAPLYSGYDYVGRTFFVNTTFKF